MSSKNKLKYDIHTLYKIQVSANPTKNVLYLHPAVCNQNNLRCFQDNTFLDNIQMIALGTRTGYELPIFANILSKKYIELYDVYLKKKSINFWYGHQRYMYDNVRIHSGKSDRIWNLTFF